MSSLRQGTCLLLCGPVNLEQREFLWDKSLIPDTQKMNSFNKCALLWCTYLWNASKPVLELEVLISDFTIFEHLRLSYLLGNTVVLLPNKENIFKYTSFFLPYF